MTERAPARIMTGVKDTLKSLTTGLGSEKDKTVSQMFALNLRTEAELTAMHRSDWLARKIVDIIPNDMTREWRDWQAADDQIEKLEELESSPLINLQVKVNQALQKARLLGGAAIFMGMADQNHAVELDIERVKAGDLKYLHVLSKWDVTPGTIIRDVTSPYFGEPENYSVRGTNGNTVLVHPSRMVRFIGAPILDDRLQTPDGWGDSVLQIIYDAIQNAASAQAHVAALIPEAKTDVIYIPNLSDHLKDATTTKALTDRFTYANTMKSLFNMLLMQGNGANGDTSQGEKWEQKQINFAQLPELMRQFMQIASGAADIPVTRLLGESPAGLNATGKSDLQNYYDNIAARQRTELTPSMHRLDEVIIRSALGARDPKIHYTWAALWGLSDSEKAEIFAKKCTAARALAGSSAGELIPVEALSDALVNTFVEDGSLPGLEEAIEKYGNLAENAPSEEELAAAAAVGNPQPGQKPGVPANQNKLAQKKAANDAAPLTLYVRRDVVNKADLVRWAKSQGFTDIVPDLHVTIAYSKTPVDWFKVGTSWSEKLDIAAGGPRQMDRLGPDGKYIALLITASELVWRHKEIIEAGATWDWPDYQPHISIQIGGDIDVGTIEPYRDKIVLGPEIFEEVKKD